MITLQVSVSLSIKSVQIFHLHQIKVGSEYEGQIPQI